MDERWWAVLSNLFYLVPASAALIRKEWLRAAILLGVGAASTWHHSCESFGCEASAKCSDVHCYSVAAYPRRVRELDHTFAVLAFYSIAMLFVPMNTDFASRVVELFLHIPPAVGIGVAAHHVIDTPSENGVYVAIIAGWLIVSAIFVRCVEGRSTAKRLQNFTGYCCSRSMSVRQRGAWAVFLVVIGITLFVWFYSDWASREPHHGLWHTGTAIAATVIIWLISRDRGDQPYSPVSV